MAQKQGRIDLNTANEQDLMQIEGVSRERAKNIIEYRNQHGPFRTWDDVKKIPGFDEKMLDLFKSSNVTCSQK